MYQIMCKKIFWNMFTPNHSLLQYYKAHTFINILMNSVHSTPLPPYDAYMLSLPSDFPPFNHLLSPLKQKSSLLIITTYGFVLWLWPLSIATNKKSPSLSCFCKSVVFWGICVCGFIDYFWCRVFVSSLIL